MFLGTCSVIPIASLLPFSLFPLVTVSCFVSILLFCTTIHWSATARNLAFMLFFGSSEEPEMKEPPPSLSSQFSPTTPESRRESAARRHSSFGSASWKLPKSSRSGHSSGENLKVMPKSFHRSRTTFCRASSIKRNMSSELSPSLNDADSEDIPKSDQETSRDQSSKETPSDVEDSSSQDEESPIKRPLPKVPRLPLHTVAIHRRSRLWKHQSTSGSDGEYCRMRCSDTPSQRSSILHLRCASLRHENNQAAAKISERSFP